MGFRSWQQAGMYGTMPVRTELPSSMYAECFATRTYRKFAEVIFLS